MNEAARDEPLERLLEFLRQQRGFDFTGYKRPSLMRRIKRRMQDLHIEQFDEYADYLEVHPEEFALLFNAILINVTSFFRDENAWNYLRTEVLPALVAAKGEAPLRVWSAGCASGQEAFSIAILLAEAMGADAFRERAKVYATDVDEDALSQARLASYTAKEMEGLDAGLRDRYFEQSGSRFVFRNDLRRSVIFGRHDLVQDAPISRLDLLLCRNALMYFNAETQARILDRFHFALTGGPQNGGVLFLGRAEMLLTHGELFAPIDLKSRIFAKVPQPEVRLRIAAPPLLAANENRPVKSRLRELALEDAAVPRIVVDVDGTLDFANQRARVLFSLTPKAIGRPLSELELSYRPADLRTLIEQAYAERRTVTLASVERRFNDREIQYLDIVVQPLYDEAQAALGVAITFLDVTRATRLQEELQRSREQVQTANEELQSSNEELETTNEELQSTNEELETMNEELQSTNEELQTVNEELRTRTEEMNQLNAFLESVLTGMRSAAIVIDHNYNVLVWNRRAEDLWGLRSDEVRAKSLLGLDIGLPVGELRPIIRACLSGEADHKEIALDATNRRGKPIRCHVTGTPLVSSSKKREGVILIMDEAA